MNENPAEKNKKPKNIKWIIRTLLFVVILIFILIITLNNMIGYTANSRFEALNGNAKIIWKYADSYIRKDNIENDIELFGYDVWDGRDIYWAIVIENGRIEYTLFSFDKITKNEIEVPDKDLQIQILSNIFTKNDAVGHYNGND